MGRAGGVFIGFNEPSYTDRVTMSGVLGIDIDDGRLLCHGTWSGRAESDAQAHFTCKETECPPPPQRRPGHPSV